MGRVKKLLHTAKLKPVADRYSDMYSVEVCEDFHIHWRNLRLQFDQREWIEFVQVVMASWEEWRKIGGPAPHPDRSVPLYLQIDKINPTHGINGTNFRIEDDDLNGPAIHVHYRSDRLEFSHEEFLAIADGFTEAAKKLRGE